MNLALFLQLIMNCELRRHIRFIISRSSHLGRGRARQRERELLPFITSGASGKKHFGAANDAKWQPRNEQIK